jgi:uncharacterized membrane protein YagU involved in acid resistance
MVNYWDGLVAGFVATLVLSMLMVGKGMMGVMPELDPIRMISGMAGNPDQRSTGWVVHFAIGIVAWGLLFAALTPVIPGAYWLKGTIFGIGAWVAMMIFVMPMAGKGLFGLKINPMAPAATLMLHIVFGLVLGATYAALVPIAGAPHG